ncbi:hypothetical protein [Terrimonas pollutisoli]|uniref:hypothetical protein n=1 Tax=Terrimonas pollutisoli TaxID=3034147 RepID=UPI0023EE1D63|nr:hypothetical protein [Terrimonas sp. H1YJ31]
MSFFKKIFGKSDKQTQEVGQEILSANTSNKLIDNSLFPIIKVGQSPAKKFVTADGQEIELPDASLPVMKQIGNSGLSIIIGVDKGGHFEWLQNKHLESSLDETINKAYRNLLSKGDLSIGQIQEKGLEDSKVEILLNPNGLASSYIMVDQVWDKIFAFCNSTDITFIIPNQDKFLFCSSTDLEATIFLEAMSLMMSSQQPKALSNNVFIKRHVA